MVRKKASNPLQLGDVAQRLGSWDLSTVNSVSDAHPDIAALLKSGTSDAQEDEAQPSTSENGGFNLTWVRCSTASSAEGSTQDDVLTLVSDDDSSPNEIEELPVLQPILSLGTRGRRDRVSKSVVFNVADEYSDSSDDDYVPVPTRRSSAARHASPDIDDSSDELAQDDDSIEVLSESVGTPLDYESDDDIVLDFDGYEVARKAKQRKKRGEIQYYGEFEKVLDNFLIKVKINRDDSKSAACLFNEVKFVLFSDLDLSLWEKCDSCYLYICPDIDSSALYFEWATERPKPRKQTQASKKKKKPDSFKHFQLSGFVNDALWCGFASARNFHLKFASFDPTTKEVTVHVYLLHSALRELQHPSEVITSMRGLSDTVCLLYDIELPVYTGTKKLKHDFDILFTAVKNYHEGKKYLDESVQHPSLIPVLRPYQRAAVQWMLFKENVRTRVEEDEEPKMHCLFVELTALDGTKLYYNKYGGYFVKNKPIEILPTPGGILADEMGLGKTVEVLACILNNPCGPLPKPEYLAPVILEELPQGRRRKKKTASDDIINFDTDEEEEKSNEAEQGSIPNNELSNSDNNDLLVAIRALSPKPGLNSSSDSEIEVRRSSRKRKLKVESEDEDYVVETSRSKRGPRRAKPQQLVSSDDEANDESYGGKRKRKASKNHTDDDSSKPRTKRRRKCSFSYSDMDDLCYDSSPVSSDDEEPCKTRRRTRRSRQTDSPATSPPPKKVKRNRIDEEISLNPNWLTIETVIRSVCWNNDVAKYKKEGSYKEFADYLRQVKKDPTYLMSLKEKLFLQYKQETAIYSCASAASKDYNKTWRQSFFKTKVARKAYFECICGEDKTPRDAGREQGTVQCSVCGLHQHARCVEYDTRDPYRGVYVCPHCWTQQPPVPSGATLIVAPSSITYQWVDEISKHLRHRALKLLVYKGMAHQGYLQPRTLASFDLVVTSYETLSRELNYVDLPHSNSDLGRRFRYPKRFMAAPTPLLSVLWWRCVLDEAQLVETTTARTAHMALRLQAQHRWCVTGTPIQRSLHDLQGLLLFLGVDPWGLETWWTRVMYESYCYGDVGPLHALLPGLMWRNTKKDIIHQIDLPPQTETIHWVQFSGVEEHFYRQLHNECSRDARHRLSKFGDRVRLGDLDRKTLAHLLQPLLKLRQACNHPQVVRGAFTRPREKGPLSMVELLERLVERTKTQAEDAHRVLVKARNGLAAVCVIRHEWAEAAEHYRAVLSSAAEHAHHFKTDSLQRLHALHNLHELLAAGHPNIPHTLDDDELAQRAADIKEKYLKQYSTKMKEAQKDCHLNQAQVMQLEEARVSKTDWWLSTLQAFGDDFVKEVRDELLSLYSRFEENKSVLYHVLSKHQLKTMLQTRTKLINAQRKAMIKGVESLADADPKDLLEAAIDCHLRPTERKPPQCKICAIHELFREYEKNLFLITDKQHTRTTEKSKETADIKEKAQVMEATRKGNFGLSEVEKIFKYLQTRSLGKVSAEVHEDGQTHLKIFEAMKREFFNYRIFWRCIFDLVSGHDEVNMATLRLRLRYPDEELPPKLRKVKKKNEGDDLLRDDVEVLRYVLEENEVAEEELKFRNEKIVNENELRIKLGQLLYLQNLQKKDVNTSGGQNPDPCPICHCALGEDWAVLLCGHCFCKGCMMLICTRKNILVVGLQRGSVKCPLCRQLTMVRDISYVDNKVSVKKDEDLSVKVVGSLSSKTEEVVRVMLRIKSEDPKAKVLVFSSWNEVLDVIADGLAQNGIPFRMLKKGNKFQVNLSAFRSRSEITALLLPIMSGANGLNLTEAGHVFLVDPLLNPAAELQAVGRIHRMGQTKATVVHRFLVRGTIEHRMFRILGSLHHYPGRAKTTDDDTESPGKSEAGVNVDRPSTSTEGSDQAIGGPSTSTEAGHQSIGGPSTSTEANDKSIGGSTKSVEVDDASKRTDDPMEDQDEEEEDQAPPASSDELSMTIGDLKTLFAFLGESDLAGDLGIPQPSCSSTSGKTAAAEVDVTESKNIEGRNERSDLPGSEAPLVQSAIESTADRPSDIDAGNEVSSSTQDESKLPSNEGFSHQLSCDDIASSSRELQPLKISDPDDDLKPSNVQKSLEEKSFRASDQNNDAQPSAGEASMDQTSADASPHCTDALRGDARVSPADAPVSPADAPVSPADAPVSPADAPVSPAYAPVSPADAPVSPADAPVSPADARVSPAHARVSPADALGSDHAESNSSVRNNRDDVKVPHSANPPAETNPIADATHVSSQPDSDNSFNICNVGDIVSNEKIIPGGVANLTRSFNNTIRQCQVLDAGGATVTTDAGGATVTTDAGGATVTTDVGGAVDTDSVLSADAISDADDDVSQSITGDAGTTDAGEALASSTTPSCNHNAVGVTEDSSSSSSCTEGPDADFVGFAAVGAGEEEA
ncbi:E3 ubiquitin-protein ligase SHPRH [Hyalella azteca]|uniref:E3 ubiquitin-protein ligase SHPRH n=1 Tax=Hyalella azteca TaxID=294128 RepID=A0A979FTB5_HYAAZ|nr:E3 ubiquitin-protein ligase SHPRH [Hyalella azteca]